MDNRRFDWTEFVKTHHDENAGVVIHTPFYNWVVDNYPIVFINKLTTITDHDEVRLQTAAALMITDVAANPHFAQELHRGVNTAVLRRSSIRLILNAAAIIEVEEAGVAFAAKLLHFALESGGEWVEFVRLTRRTFYSRKSRLLCMVLDVLCALPTELMARFVNLLEPSIRETYAIFPYRMIQLLQKGTDYRPYFLLANVCRLFTEPQWSSMMEAAIMSSFFYRVSSSSRRVLVASSLRICFDHDAYFYVSLKMYYKMRAIISCLHKSGEPLEQRAAMELYEAFARRVYNYPIPRQ